MKKQQQIEEIRKEIASLTEKLNKLEKAEVRPREYVEFKRVICGLSHKYHEKLIILNNLLCLRDEWNEIDGYECARKNKGFCVLNSYVNLLEVSDARPFIFKFKDKPTAQLFLETFRPQLEQIKELL